MVFEAAGAPDTPRLVADLCAIGGKVILIGICASQSDVAFDSTRCRRKGLSIKWCRRSRLAVEASIRLVEQGVVDARSMVTHHFNLDDTQHAFELFEQLKNESLKIVINPNG